MTICQQRPQLLVAQLTGYYNILESMRLPFGISIKDVASFVNEP